METNEAEKKKETQAKDHDTRLRELSDLLKRNNIQIIEVPEDEEREKGAKWCNHFGNNLGISQNFKRRVTKWPSNFTQVYTQGN